MKGYNGNEVDVVNEDLGGIKERMHKARTGYRQGQDERLAQLEAECQQWQEAYDSLKARALESFHRQQQEIESLKAELQELKKQP